MKYDYSPRVEAARAAKRTLTPAMRGGVRWFAEDSRATFPRISTIDALTRRGLVADFSRLTPLDRDVAALMGLLDWTDDSPPAETGAP